MGSWVSLLIGGNSPTHSEPFVSPRIVGLSLNPSRDARSPSATERKGLSHSRLAETSTSNVGFLPKKYVSPLRILSASASKLECYFHVLKPPGKTNMSSADRLPFKTFKTNKGKSQRYLSKWNVILCVQVAELVVCHYQVQELGTWHLEKRKVDEINMEPKKGFPRKGDSSKTCGFQVLRYFAGGKAI